MSHCINLVGNKYNRLLVVGKTDKRTKDGCVLWQCVCDCGNKVLVSTTNLKSNHTKSCGCIKDELIKTLSKKYCTTHGKRNTRLYNIYQHMRARCYNINNKDYNSYGGRGIKICDEWKNDFLSFYNWSMNNGYQDDLTIDRIDVNGNYEPKNCRWATRLVQNNNKRNLHYITYKGVTKTLSEWCTYFNLNYNTIERRINHFNWSIEKALTTPIKKKRDDKA